MQSSRNLSHASTHEENHPMFLRQLSSSFLPCSRPAFCRAGLRSSSSSSHLPRFIPTPHPWCSVWPPQLHPAARQVYSGRTLHPQNINFGRSWRPFTTSAGLMMEGTDREPPHKRRKSIDNREHRGGAAGSTGGSKRDSSTDGPPQPNHHFKDGHGGNNRARKGSFSWGNRSKKDVERTKAGDKDRQQKDSQLASSQTQRSKSKPEQEKAPNPWFKGRGAEEQRGQCERSTGGPEGQIRDRSSDGGQRTELFSQPCSTTHPPNPWQVARANQQPPPPGSSLLGRRQDDVKPKSLRRHWEDSSAYSDGSPPPGDSTAFDFSVMSYNILSQQLLQDNIYLYRHCNPGVLPWDHRLPNLLAEIQQYNADILCLQEVQEDHYETQIKPALQALGYQCEYKKRTGNKPDGCAVAFKTSRLSLLSSNPVEFFRPGESLLDRDNVGLVLLLQPNDPAGRSDPSSFICVANTHLLYNPRRGDIKLAQLAILLAEISRLSRLSDGSTSPVVLCGDLNSTPWSPLYKFLTTGHLKYRGLQSSMVSGQESSPKGQQRPLSAPLWSRRLGINHQCQYENEPSSDSSCSPTVEGAISNLTVEDLASNTTAAATTTTSSTPATTTTTSSTPATTTSTSSTPATTNAANRLEHTLKLQSSYQHHLKPDGRPEITTCHSRTATTVDYILYTPEFITPPSLPGGRGLQLLGRLPLVGQSELRGVNGLPNQYHSSDHLALLVRFRLRR